VMRIHRLDSGRTTVQLCDGIDFSVRRAMAVGHVMVLVDGRKRPRFLPLMDREIRDSVSTLSSLQPPSTQTILHSVAGLAQSSRLFQHALVWTFYVERIYYAEGRQELLQTPQLVLQARLQAIAELETYPSLEKTLEGFFPGQKELVKNILTALSRARNDQVTTESHVSPGTKERSPTDCYSYVNLWPHYRSCKHLLELRQAFDPALWTRPYETLDVSQMNGRLAVLARIILVVSIIQTSQKEAWGTLLEIDGRYLPQASPCPLLKLLERTGQRADDLCINIS